ncbi:LacI family DNA-binding transcriptional regulator [Paenibacillus sp. GCM10027628]|uniref:LacI family DNA-binding transcriptional regulator n=1 Tax=Paenibacillus sp. GCM10027628 TaxID=3273413 RepID=UPI00363E22C1
MKPTIYDVAKAAGVSSATVSKVINHTGRISEKTRDKIRTIMNEINYRPDVLASAMKGKCTYQIALLIPDMDNPIYAQYLKYIEDRGRELGFSVVMCSTDNDPDKEEQHISLLRQKRVDGFIIASKFTNKELLQELLADQVPVVLFAHERQDVITDSVTVDDYLGGVLATEHLISHGHTRIGVIATDSISCWERIRGYESAISNAGIKLDRALVETIEGSKIDDAEKAALKMLKMNKNGVSAIFGCNDIMAIGVMQAAKKLGLSIPKDLSIIGFDNTELCKIVTPELTSIAMPINELGHKAMDMIVDKIDRSGNAKQKIKMLPELVVRNSVSQYGK